MNPYSDKSWHDDVLSLIERSKAAKQRRDIAFVIIFISIISTATAACYAVMRVCW